MTNTLTRREISDAVTHLGWRLVLNQLTTTIRVPSLADGAAMAARLIGGVGDETGDNLLIDLRPDTVVVTLQGGSEPLTRRELDRAAAISAAVTDLGRETVAGVTGTPAERPARPVQTVEFAVDALDIAAIRPFWKAVLGYADAGDGSLVDPLGQGFPVWFQQMDEPREQRNRIHLDVSVPHDDAAARREATLAAGGVLVSDAEAPAFWIMADVEGNEVCICTWQGRDPEDTGPAD